MAVGTTCILKLTIVTRISAISLHDALPICDSAINSAALNGGQVTVDPTRTLTLDDTTVTGTTIADNEIGKAHATTPVTLRTLTPTAAASNNYSTNDIIGDSPISNAALSYTQ